MSVSWDAFSALRVEFAQARFQSKVASQWYFSLTLILLIFKDFFPRFLSMLLQRSLKAWTRKLRLWLAMTRSPTRRSHPGSRGISRLPSHRPDPLPLQRRRSWPHLSLRSCQGRSQLSIPTTAWWTSWPRPPFSAWAAWATPPRSTRMQELSPGPAFEHLWYFFLRGFKWENFLLFVLNS